MSGSPATGRLGYLDWLRGVTVLVMIQAHAFDAWTRPDEKARLAYGWLMVLGGMAAPAFLFMAGVAVALGAAAHLRRGRRRLRQPGWSSAAGGRSSLCVRLPPAVLPLGGFSNRLGC